MDEITININPDLCTSRTKDALERMMNLAKRNNSEFVTPEHLLDSIAKQKEFIAYCLIENVPLNAMREELKEYMDNIDKIPETEQPELSVALLNLIEMINDEAGQDGPISVPLVLSNIYELESSYASHMLRKYLGDDIDSWFDSLFEYYVEDIEPLRQHLPQGNTQLPTGTKIIKEIKIDTTNLTQEELFQKLLSSAGNLFGSINELKQKAAGTKQKEPWEAMVTNISETFAWHNPLVGREEELDTTIQILCQKDKNNAMHVGEAGVGKTALVYGLARRIASGDIPERLKGSTIYMLDMATLVAGASYHGEFEKRMKEIMEGMKRRGNCICYIDEIHNIMGTGGSGNSSLDAGNILKPYLEAGDIRFIGSTTYDEYNRHMAKSKGIVRRFQQIDILEPSVEDTVQIIEEIIHTYEAHHGVRYDKAAIAYAVEQSDKLIVDRFLPDKAITIIDRAGAYRQTHPLLNKKGEPMTPGRQKVDKALIADIISHTCKINAKALTEQGNVSLRDLSQRIGAEIYGQQEAIDHVVRAVKMSKAGLTMGDKPLASLLFVGPTGVGKTEVCRVLARELGIDLVRFDMSEYTEKHAVAKLIGSPAGYVGYDDGGLLTDAIRKSPNCVLLLDEIEKAHEDIYNILLQVMDYAKLTDNKGNKADFKNVILIMTSNAGAQYATQATIGFAGGISKGEAMMQTVRKTFKPEFLNRLSGTVVFNDMDHTMASLILDKKLRQLASLLERKNVTLTLTDEAHALLLDKGFTRQYGAREMDRTIQNLITPLLMDEILFGSLQKGGTAIIDRQGDTVTLRVKKKEKK